MPESLPGGEGKERTGARDRTPALRDYRIVALAVIGSVVPDFVGEVAAEEASYLFGARVSTVEEPTGGEVVEVAIYRELQVRRDHLVRVVPQIAEASEDALGRGIPM